MTRARAGCLVLGFLAVACGSCTSGSGDGSGDQTPTPLPDIPALAPPVATEPYQPTTVENIEAAYESGDLTMEQRLLYEFAALYGAGQVPASYLGAPEPPLDHAFLFALLDAQWSSLSADAQTALKPFTLPPTDSASFFHLDSLPSSLRDVQWDGQTLSNGIVVQWPVNPARTDLPARIAAVVAAATEVPPMFRALLGYPLPHVDIYVMPASAFSSGGEPGDSQPAAGGCYVRLRDDVTAPVPHEGDLQAALNIMKSTTAHELFHCVQFQIFGGLPTDNTFSWLYESTATWSENYAYPDYQVEQYQAGRYLYATGWDLLSTRSFHHYGAYMWHFFLAQYSSPAEVTYALFQSQSPYSPRLMLANRAGFSDELGEFAVWNWNRDPFTYYSDPPPPVFPTSADGTESRHPNPIGSAGAHSVSVQIGKGGIGYYEIELTNPDLNKLTFDLTGLGAAAGGPVAVTAILQLDSGTFRESWTGLDKAEFCRKVPDQNLGRAIVIVSNANLQSPFSASFAVTAEERCGPGWIGSIRMRWRRDDVWTGSSAAESWVNNDNHAGEAVIREHLVYDAANDGFVVKKMSFSARDESRNGRVKVRDEVGTCGIVSETHRSSQWGAGSNEYPEQDPEGTHTRFYGSNPGSGFYGGAYSLDFTIFPPASGAASGQWHGTSVTREVPSLYDTFIGIPCDAHIAEVSSPLEDPAFPTPTSADIDILVGDTTIRGTTSYELGSGWLGPIVMTVDWEYVKVH
jgi:hypothetical protein